MWQPCMKLDRYACPQLASALQSLPAAACIWLRELISAGLLWQICGRLAQASVSQAPANGSQGPAAESVKEVMPPTLFPKEQGQVRVGK